MSVLVDGMVFCGVEEDAMGRPGLRAMDGSDPGWKLVSMYG